VGSHNALWRGTHQKECQSINSEGNVIPTGKVTVKMVFACFQMMMGTSAGRMSLSFSSFVPVPRMQIYANVLFISLGENCVIKYGDMHPDPAKWPFMFWSVLLGDESLPSNDGFPILLKKYFV
jgi:hypothetical protein